MTPPPHSPVERLAERIEAGARSTGLRRLSAALFEIGTLDEAVYAAVAATPTPILDEPMRRLSRVADRSVLWMGIAAAMAVTGGRRGRRAAAAGLGSVAITSAVVNLGVKPAYRRTRPDREGAGVPTGRHVRMPGSTSFPSGHSASAFAFATGAGGEFAALALPLRTLATIVAYSRVHTGVHYPADVVTGSVLGGTAGQLTGRLFRHYMRDHGGRGRNRPTAS